VTDDPSKRPSGADPLDDAHDEEAEAAAAEAAEAAGALAGGPSEVPLLTNGQLAQVFHDIGDQIGRAHV